MNTDYEEQARLDWSAKSLPLIINTWPGPDRWNTLPNLNVEEMGKHHPIVEDCSVPNPSTEYGVHKKSSEGRHNFNSSWKLGWGQTPLIGAGYESGFFKGCFHIDNLGLYHRSSMNDSRLRPLVESFSSEYTIGEVYNRMSFRDIAKFGSRGDKVEWKGVVFPIQNPTDRSIYAPLLEKYTGSKKRAYLLGDRFTYKELGKKLYWEAVEKVAQKYGSSLYLKYHPGISPKLYEENCSDLVVKYGCKAGHADSDVILSSCAFVVLYNSTMAVDCFIKGVPVVQVQDGYFGKSGAVHKVNAKHNLPNLQDDLRGTVDYAKKLVNFLAWKYCTPMSQLTSKELVELFLYYREESFKTSEGIVLLPPNYSYMERAYG